MPAIAARVLSAGRSPDTDEISPRYPAPGDVAIAVLPFGRRAGSWTVDHHILWLLSCERRNTPSCGDHSTSRSAAGGCGSFPIGAAGHGQGGEVSGGGRADDDGLGRVGDVEHDLGADGGVDR